DVTGLDDVLQGVEAVVAVEVGDGEATVVEDLDEPGGTAARRHVQRAVGSAGSHEHERRPGDEVAHPLVDVIDRLVENHLVRGAVELPQLVDAGQRGGERGVGPGA